MSAGCALQILLQTAALKLCLEQVSVWRTKAVKSTALWELLPPPVALDGLPRELLSGLQNRKLEEEGQSLQVSHSVRKNAGGRYAHEELTKSKKTRHLLSFRSHTSAEEIPCLASARNR